MVLQLLMNQLFHYRKLIQIIIIVVGVLLLNIADDKIIKRDTVVKRLF